MTDRRRYSRKQRAEAVGLSVVAGRAEAVRRTGIPESTLRYWEEDPEFAELRARKKDDVALEVWAAFQTGVRRIVELVPLTDDMTKVATATGILFDKYALMTGHATERTESRDLTATFDDGEREAMERFLHDLAQEHAHTD